MENFFFYPEPLLHEELITEYKIFQGLFIRNLFSIIKGVTSTRAVNKEYADLLCNRTIDHFLLERDITPQRVLDFSESIYSDWVSRQKTGHYLENDIDFIKIYFMRSFSFLDQIASTILTYAKKIKQPIYDEIVTEDCNLIIKLLNVLDKTPKQLINNFSYGWEGFSTGELAKLNIFASIYNYLKNNQDDTHLLIIDEVDLYLHPEWQRTFMSELISFVNAEFKKNIIQFIITTHSPLIIGDFLPEDLISLQKDDLGIPYIGKSFGFGTEITDAYISGMHIESTFGEHSRKKILALISKKNKGILDDDDYKLIRKLEKGSFRRMFIND